MSHRVRVGLAGLGRMGRIHAASLAARCPSAELAVQAARAGKHVFCERTQDGVRYTVKQESR